MHNGGDQRGIGMGAGRGAKKRRQIVVITGGRLQMEGKSVRHLHNIRGDLALAS